MSAEQPIAGRKSQSVSFSGRCAEFSRDICVQNDPDDAVLPTGSSWQCFCRTLYALDLAADAIYSVLGAYGHLRLDIEEAVLVQRECEKRLFGAHNAGKACRKRVILQLRRLYARVSARTARKSLFFRALGRVLDIRSLRALCSMGGDETSAFLALLSAFLRTNDGAFDDISDIMVGKVGRQMLRVLVLCAEKMYEKGENFEELSV